MTTKDIPITAALQDYRYIYFGMKDVSDKDNPWKVKPAMCVSNDLINWKFVSYFDKDLGNLRDASVKKIDDTYYIVGTWAEYKTKDFFTFESMPFKLASGYTEMWAPEIFIDADNQPHVVYCVSKDEQGTFSLKMADMDRQGNVSNPEQTVTFTDGEPDNLWCIDPDVYYQDGWYYLTTAGNYIYRSQNYLGPYSRYIVNFTPTPQRYGRQWSGLSGWVEGPQMFRDGDSVRLFADQTCGNGLVYRSADADDLTDWTQLAFTNGPGWHLRHGCVMVNELVSEEENRPQDLPELKWDKKVKIRGLQGDEDVPLTCFFRNSFTLTYADNETNQITFTAYNDGSPSWDRIAVESTVTFNDQPYMIKTVSPKLSDSDTVDVTAIHYINSELTRVVQPNVNTGTITYTVDKVCSFFLNDPQINPFGFNYHIYGSFDKQQIENLGNCSAKDMISKILDTWPGTIIYPEGKTIGIWSQDAWRANKNFQRRIDYIRDTSDITMNSDSTDIVNKILCIGATKDADTTDSSNNGKSSDSNQNNAISNASLDNATAFAKSPINASFGVDKQVMINDFTARDHRVRAWGVDANKLYDTVKNAGVSPEWFFAYDICEQDPMYWSWLNHFNNHLSDPYADAVRVCNWIKQISYGNAFNPASADGRGVGSATAAKWNSEFGKGTIGRVYLQGTAAAVWELAGMPGGIYGKPLSQCVSIIKSWGGHSASANPGNNTSSTTSSTSGGAAKVQADAKKYLGVPYVWGGGGGARGGNPWNGMDCSSYVSQVYKDFGIYIPAYTVSMEPYGHQIPRSQVQTGDMGFYGSHGGSTHICLALDNNTMIYEPQPGQRCKMEPISYFPPTWWERNDKMAAIVAQQSQKQENTDDNQDKNAPSQDAQNQPQYYFAPFYVTDEHSIQSWGVHPAQEALEDDRFKDPVAMRNYALKKLQPEPVMSIELTLKTNEPPIPGETARLNIRPRHYSTDVTVVGFTWKPYDQTTGTDLTFDNIPQSLLDYGSFNLKNLSKMLQTLSGTMPQVYYGGEDPTQKHNVKNGALWTHVVQLDSNTEQKGSDQTHGKPTHD